MRLLWLSIVAILVAVATIAAIPHISDSYIIALVVAPMAICVACAWILLLQNRGFRASRGWKEVVLFGPLQAQPDNWGHRIANLPAFLLLAFIAVSAGTLIGTMWTILL
jgi:hypothetical protein